MCWKPHLLNAEPASQFPGTESPQSRVAECESSRVGVRQSPKAQSPKCKAKTKVGRGLNNIYDSTSPPAITTPSQPCALVLLKTPACTLPANASKDSEQQSSLVALVRAAHYLLVHAPRRHRGDGRALDEDAR